MFSLKIGQNLCVEKNGRSFSSVEFSDDYRNWATERGT